MKSFTQPSATLPIWDDDSALTHKELKKYQPLLYKIGVNFGFNDSETNRLIQQVYADADRNNVEQELRHTMRICLSKLMVYKCIFIVSKKFFSQDTRASYIGASFKYYSESGMPLSYKAAYILNHNIGFTEAEVSELLNTSPIKVKERLHKARSFVNNF